MVVVPGDPVEARLATKAIAKQQGPCYSRLGKVGEPLVYETEPKFKIGYAIKIKEGKDVTLISTGGMLKETIEASKNLENNEVSVAILSMHTLKPIDSQAILESLDTKFIATIEEHSAIGGLGSAIAEILAENNSNYTRLLSINLGPDLP